MRLVKSLYASGVLNNGKVVHCNEWDIGDYESTRGSAARLVERAQQRWEPISKTTPNERLSRWKVVKNVLRIG
jgi:hypothetical protein